MKKIAIVLCFAMLAALLAGCGPLLKQAPIPEELTTTEFEVIGFDNIGGIHLMVTTDFGNDDHTLTLAASQEEFASRLYHFCSKLTLRASYDKDYNLYDYSVIETATGTDLGKLDAEELENAFNPERKYQVAPMIYNGDPLPLSSIQENILYKVATGGVPFIAVQNDTDSNFIVYGEDSEMAQEEKLILPGKIAGEQTTPNEFSAFSDYYYIRVQIFDDESAPYVYGEENIFRLSNAKPGEELQLGTAGAVFNDTGKLVRVIDENEDTREIPAGQLVGFDRLNVPFWTME